MLRSIPTKWFTINHYWRFDHMLWPSSEYIKQTETREQREICTLSSSSLYTDWLRGSQMTSLIIVSNWCHLGLWSLSLFCCCLVVCLLLCSIRRFRQQSMLGLWSLFISSLGFWREMCMAGFLDQQDGGVVRLIQDPCLLLEGLVVLGPDMLSNGWLLNLSSPGVSLMLLQSGYPTPSSSHQCISVHKCMKSHTPPLMPALQNLCPCPAQLMS